MDATELLKRMANGTLPIHAMSIWNSTLLSIWATTGIQIYKEQILTLLNCFNIYCLHLLNKYR